jgi:hypothetical protein
VKSADVENKTPLRPTNEKMYLPSVVSASKSEHIPNRSVAINEHFKSAPI